VSGDIRNSLVSWGSVIALAVVFWAALRLDPFRNVPVEWIWGAGFVVATLNLLKFGYGLWSRRTQKGHCNV
jgi:hypothetical protein